MGMGVWEKSGENTEGFKKEVRIGQSPHTSAPAPGGKVRPRGSLPGPLPPLPQQPLAHITLSVRLALGRGPGQPTLQPFVHRDWPGVGRGRRGLGCLPLPTAAQRLLSLQHPGCSACHLLAWLALEKASVSFHL